MISDLHPLSAATALNPYPYYAHLVAERPLYRHEALAMWIASGASYVEGALANDALHVRPSGEPVPASLAGTTLGRVFAHFARTTDGAMHAAAKHAVLAALWSVSRGEVAQAVARCARMLIANASLDACALDRYIFALPVATMSALLGFDDDELLASIDATTDLVAALAPSAPDSAIVRGEGAVDRLLRIVDRRLADVDDRSPLGLLAGRVDDELFTREAARANAIGLLFQSHDAVAGLIGNMLCAGPNGGMHLEALAEEIARIDPPVHNTRRFAVRDTTIGDVMIRRGETVLVLLAAANLDPERGQPLYTFGLGAHACPGTRIAMLIAANAVAHVRPHVEAPPRAASYRPAANVRIPLFAEPRAVCA